MTLIGLAVLLILIVIGVFLIHNLNAQHDARIADFRYSDALPGIGRRRRRHGRAARRGRSDPEVPVDGTQARPEPPTDDRPSSALRH
ncbi:hypothetical protein ACGFYT_18385 [Streptomyces sp. NPDC048208]|uniref:hypothetical protein n=1 Tax=unclassified Streptomyces TaxID=2593676 RepID=UPI0033DE53BB